jgi:endoglucanase
LGNTFDAVSRSASSSPTQQETAWHNPVTTVEMVKAVKDVGFDIFRLPVTWYPQLGPAPDYVIKREWLNRVNEVLDYAYNLGMTVIINMHHENWHFPSEENYPAASEILKKVWEQIAEHFKNYDEKLIFEAMNEPRKVKTPVEWTGGDEEGRGVVMKLNQDFVDTVRATGGNNATRMLMVPIYAASSDEPAMKDFVQPKGENIITSIHAYTPYEFALSNNQQANKWQTSYEKDIDALFARVNKYLLQKGYSVIMGECGARRKGENTEDRVQWAKYYTAAAKKHNVPCVWWDNGSMEGPDTAELFGLLNRKECKWEFPLVVDAFLQK